MARTLELDRANHAWERVKEMKAQPKVRGRYGARVRDMGALIMTDGLGQSLAYLRAKGKSGQAGDNRSPEQAAHHLLFKHLSAWVLHALQAETTDPNAHVLHQLLNNDQNFYRRATTETLAYLTWLKKFADAEFGDEIDQVVATEGGGSES